MTIYLRFTHNLISHKYKSPLTQQIEDTSYGPTFDGVSKNDDGLFVVIRSSVVYFWLWKHIWCVLEFDNVRNTFHFYGR